jgi:hypothetical protein
MVCGVMICAGSGASHLAGDNQKSAVDLIKES